jgi:MEMO1 family protein
MLHSTRPAAVAGSFYPENPGQLRAMISQFIAGVNPPESAPKALIVPHAGYIYSGPIAASAYARLQAIAATIKRVILIGPSHRVAFAGLALSHADEFATPLGNIPIDTQTREQLSRLPFVTYLDEAHSQEHSLEVQLPFLQAILKEFSLLPLVAGDATPQQICQVLEQVWDGVETLIVISSDLSHYRDYTTAQQLDRETSKKIEALEYDKLDYDSACGRVPVSGLLAFAKNHQLQIKTIDLRNSGDTAGDRRRVVGYGAYVIE